MLSFQISDRGGGIAKNKIDEVFEYHYSTAPQPTSGQVAALVSFIFDPYLLTHCLD